MKGQAEALLSGNFDQLTSHLRAAQRGMSASAAASVIMQNGQVIWEWYSGKYSHLPDAKQVDANTQFNIASCRKTYIAFAIAYALFHQRIKSIDDDILAYLPDLNVEGITLRHLLTHCHGLKAHGGNIIQQFEPGTNWQYNNAGIDLLIQIVERTTGLTVAKILQQHVFEPLGLSRTGWRTKKNENLIFNVHEDTDVFGPFDSAAGNHSNLFTTAREFARWGQLYLNKGKLDGQQLLSESSFREMTTIQSPSGLPRRLPRQGYIWWVQDTHPSSESQIGGRLPSGSFQVLGLTGCACLVIPAYSVVAVRMFNQTGENQLPGFNYLTEIRQFGDLINNLFA